jgi:streptomycin 6-kinase
VRRTDWAASLPATLAAVTERWSLSVGPPFQHDGGYSWVAPARTATNPDLVLKLGWQHPEAHHEPDGLALWQGNGAIRLHESLRLNGTTALLLERCRPGTSLRALPEPDQDVVVAGLLRRLWHRPTSPFRALHTMCDLWVTGFDTRLTADPPPRPPGPGPPGPPPARAAPSGSPSPTPRRTPGCSAPTCTPATSWPPAANPGWSSTPSLISATPPTTSSSTSSTAGASPPTPSP